MSNRTVIRDRIIQELRNLKTDDSGFGMEDFDVDTRWLTQEETKRKSTYCIVVTDETRSAHSLQHDEYEMNGVIVIYANDTRDARAKLDAMVECAYSALYQAFKGLKDIFFKASAQNFTTSEGSTAEGHWPQAVVRWSATHRRPVLA